MRRAATMLFIITVCILIVVGCNKVPTTPNPDPTTTEEPQTLIPISADDLVGTWQGKYTYYLENSSHDTLATEYTVTLRILNDTAYSWTKSVAPTNGIGEYALNDSYLVLQTSSAYPPQYGPESWIEAPRYRHDYRNGVLRLYYDRENNSYWKTAELRKVNPT